MMKKAVGFFLVCMMGLACLLFSPHVHAVESLTFGFRYWYPQWELEGYSDFDTLKWSTSFGMIGPSASLVINEKLALSASLYFGSFNKSFDLAAYQGYYTEAEWDSDRQDLDMIGVFMLNKYVNFYAGLKYLTYDQTITGTWFGEGFWKLKYDLSSYGPGLGSAFTLPIGANTALYTTLSYSYLFGDFKSSTPTATINEGDVTYPILGFEMGGRYSFDKLPLVLMLSGRYQQSTINIDWDTDWSGNALYWDKLDETFYGLILFLGYRLSFN